MSDTPRMESVAGHARGIVDAGILAEGMKLERELNAAKKRIKQLEEALDCVVVSCSYVHHRKKHQHEYGQPCPVEALIRKAKEAKP